MSDRYHRRYRSLSPEPYIVERRPRIISRSPSPATRRSTPGGRRVSFGVATHPRTKKTVVYKETTYQRKRGTSRRSRTPSPSPPRGPNHIMSERLGGEYIPLPRELPKKGERQSGSEEDDDQRKEYRRRQRKDKDKRPLVHNPDDEAYPVVESPSTPSTGRRDSGVYSGRVSPRTAKYHESKGRLITPPERRLITNEAEIQELTQQFNNILANERMDKLEAEARANRLEEQLNKAKAEIEQSKRSSWLDDRERKVSDREKSHRDEQKRLSQTSSRESLPRRDVVVSQLQPPAVSGYADPATDALAKAKSDWNKRQSGSGKKW